MDPVSFKNVAVVACGTLKLELTHLQETGFLDTQHLFFTTPGLHQDVNELERQLVDRVQRAKEVAEGVIVVYGGKFCYVNVDNPVRTMGQIIEELGPGIVRVQATHCMDMIADEQERKEISRALAGEEPVWWMTPGWVKYRKLVFKGWDKGIANENFPKHTGGAIVLDSIGYLDRYMEENPEAFLEYCDWMGIPMQGHPAALTRLEHLLVEALQTLAAA